MSAPPSMLEPQRFAASGSAPSASGSQLSRGDSVLILSASAGAGHMIAAEALEEALKRRHPQADVEVIDVLQLTNPFFRRLYAQGYLTLCNHAPSAMGWLYEAMDRPAPRYRDWLRTAFQNANAGRTIRHLIKRQPRLIVNTHFLSAEIVAQLRRQRQLNSPQVTVTTDFETHRLWVQWPTERYYTATEDGKTNLVTWGVRSEDVVVSGIPVRRGFEEAPTRSEARQHHKLPEDRPVVLMMCGGFGVGPTTEMFNELLRMPTRVKIVAVAGRNQTLYERLRRRVAHVGRDVMLIGYTSEMDTLMRAADLVVTKPGGLTTSEALVIGVPLVVVNPIPGQEARNSDFLLENGAAIKVNNARMLSHRIIDLLDAPDRLTDLVHATRRLRRRRAADLIAADASAVVIPT